MTIALERLPEGDWTVLNRVVDKLRALVPDTGGLSIGVRFGAVNANGTILAGTGFTVTKNGTGDYTVNLKFPRAPVVVVSSGSTAGNLYAKLSQTAVPSTTGFSVYTVKADTGTLTDAIFHWVASA
jgi:hypothetical protein